MFSVKDKASVPDRDDETMEEWEVRPGGMLVQKRIDTTDVEFLYEPKIRVDVKYGSSSHQIYVPPRASFGELKKILEEKTGLHPDDQKILYKKREKSSKMFLDIERVKNKSKLVLIEDAQSRDRRCLEMLKISNTQKIQRSLSEIRSQIDKSAQQVVEVEEMAYSKGEKIKEAEIENITGNLLTQLVKLQELSVRGDLSMHKTKLEKRAQRNIEKLDKLKTYDPRKFEECEGNGGHMKGVVKWLKPILKQRDEKFEEIKNGMKKSNKSVSFMVSPPRWETFD